MSGCTWKCQVVLDVCVPGRCDEVFEFACVWRLPIKRTLFIHLVIARVLTSDGAPVEAGDLLWWNMLPIHCDLEATFMLDSGLSTNLVHGPQLQSYTVALCLMFSCTQLQVQ